MEEQDAYGGNGEGFTPRSDIPEAKPDDFQPAATSGTQDDQDDIPF
jgi:hypothetical protein